MRKGLTTLLVILLAVGAMLVSCKAEVGTPADELVSASFEMGNSRALSATLEPFNPGAYYWKYAASKNEADTSGLHSGETAGYDISPEAREAGAQWVKTGTQGPVAGLAGHIVPNFSQGLWDFTLYAYKDAEGTKLAYLGEAKAVTLVKGGENMVNVVVSPAPTGTGTLYIGTTSLTPRESTDVPTVSRFLKVEDLDGHEYAPTSGTTYELAAGAYKVTVTYKTSGIVYAEGTVIATVYPNMTTTVTGSVDELVTYAQFEAEQNPDIIARTAGVDGIHKNDDVSDYYTLVEKDTPAADVKVTATVPAAAAKNLLPKDSQEQIIADASMSLLLNVDTKDSTSTSVTYEISMTKIVTRDSEVSTDDVESLGTYVEDEIVKKYYAVATVKLSTGLTGVTVTHDGHAMVNSTSTADDFLGYGVYSYDATTGILTIQTNTFSPFQVTYDGQTAGVAEFKGVKYGTLKAAFEAAKADTGASQTIKLLGNAEGDGLFLAAGSKNIIIDLAGYTYTITQSPVGSPTTKTQGLHLERGNVVTIKNGTLASTAGSGVKMLVQNYSNLTLTDVILDGSNIGEAQYTLSNNYGNILLNGSTSIKASANGYAFDAYFWPTGSYDSVGVTVDTTGTIDGIVQVWSDGNYEVYGNSVTIKAGTFKGDLDYHVGTLSIQGGTFAWDPTEYIASGYEVEYDSSTKLWTVVKQKVAKIGSTFYTSLQSAFEAAEEGNEIELLTDLSYSPADLVEYNYDPTGWDMNINCVIPVFGENIVLNGAGHTIKLKGMTSGKLFGCVKGGESTKIMDLVVDVDDCVQTGFVHVVEFGSITLDDVDIKGSVTCNSGNFGAYFVYVRASSVTMEDCDNSINISAPADTTLYDAKFFGYTTGTSSFVLTDCSNSGVISCGRATIFFANAAYSASFTLTLNGFVNDGLVINWSDYASSSSSDVKTVNYFMSGWDKNYTLAGVTIDGSGPYTNKTDSKWWQINNLVAGNGSLILGMPDSTLAISENTDHTFNIVPGSNESIHHYTVVVGLYTSTDTGSSRYYVTETIGKSDSVMTTSIKDLQFVDKAWAASHVAEQGTLCGNTTYTLGGETYYLVDVDSQYLNDHMPMNAGMISVTAFDADGNPLCAVQFK